MGECVDLVNTAGQIQLPNVLREEADQHPGLHMQIVIVVVWNALGQLLVHQRSNKKLVNPGDVDHVCGGVKAGEGPKAAARRETREETGVVLSKVQLVTSGVNAYNRYRWLFTGRSDDAPILTECDEINWVAWKSPDELERARDAGDLTFVAEFFEETAATKEVQGALT